MIHLMEGDEDTFICVADLVASLLNEGQVRL